MSDVVTGDIIGPNGEGEAPLPQRIKDRRVGVRFELVSVESIETFLQKYAETGLLIESAQMSGISYFTINRLKKADETFRELCEEALASYRELLQAEAHRRAVSGWDEPVFSQKLGTRIGVIRKYDSRLLELMLKRHIPEFREKFEGKIEVSHGVLVAPVSARSVEAWAAQHAGPQLTTYADAPALPPADPNSPPQLSGNADGGTPVPGGA